MSHAKNRSSPATLRARQRREDALKKTREGATSLLAIAADGRPAIVVELADVPESGLEVKETVPAAAMSVLLATKRGDPLSAGAAEDASVDVLLRDEGMGIFRMKGKVDAEVTHACVRCLEEVRFPLHLDLDLRLHEGTGEGAGDDRLDLASGGSFDVDDEDAEGAMVLDDDEDFVTYEGGRVDVLAVVREQIYLALPMHPTCDSDGAVTAAPCRFGELQALAAKHGSEGDPRFQALKDWAAHKAPKDVQ